ncbi:MAG: ATP-binding cassette domain-containing protein [Acidobacteria bacterium]|nr:ATP-binding cassette domain-containing protein [Acidobacteriota bacterium]
MTDDDKALVRTRALTVGYTGSPVAKVPDLNLAGGVVWHVTGANGSGKTALLKTLAGLIPPVTGNVERRCNIGAGGAIYIHPVPYLFAGTVIRNLTLADPSPHEIDRVMRLFELEPLQERDVRALSYGEQRRVALARAVASRPAVLLVDESDAGLDEAAHVSWWTYVAGAVADGAPALVVAAHRLLPCDGVPIREIHLRA